MNEHHSSGSPDDELDQVMEIISKLARKSASAKYIYRGEPQCYTEVPSGLYRENKNAPDIEAIQRNNLCEAKAYTEETDELAILTEIQHYGGKTNLIDFTKDCLVALFFACDGYHTLDGRVIFLKLDGDMRVYIHEPKISARRVLAQKSIFVRPPSGYVTPDDMVVIPSHLKASILKYLQDGHDIFASTIYSDLLGFIRSMSIRSEAYGHFDAGLDYLAKGNYQAAIVEFDRALDLNPQMAVASHARNLARLAYQRIENYGRAIEHFYREPALNDAGDYSGTALSYESEAYDGRAVEGLDLPSQLHSDPADIYRSLGQVHVSKADYNRAIDIYNLAVELMPDDAGFYAGLGVASLHLSDWARARDNLMTAREMGADIATSFHDNYNNVTDFEQQTGLTVPDDIAEMLGG